MAKIHRQLTVSGASVLATLLLGAAPAHAGKVIFNFGGPAPNGVDPLGPLTPVGDKVYCGVTREGGAGYGSGFGTFYCLTQQTDGSFQETTSISFDGNATSGSNPAGRLALSSDHTLYGVTPRPRVGSVYQVKLGGKGGSPSRLKTIYEFNDFGHGQGDGEYPAGGVVIGADGSLYGATVAGGALGHGTVYRLTPPATAGSAWTETIIHEFTDKKTYPAGGLAMDATGTLYGATTGGPKPHFGTVYALTPPPSGSSTWGFSILHNFGITADDGKSPNGDLLIGPGGVLYGTCPSADAGPGNVYSLAPPSPGQTDWQYTQLYVFGRSSPPDGTGPNGGLLLDSAGDIYGTTKYGIRVKSGAIAFRLTPGGAPNGWTETILQRFSSEKNTSFGYYPSELTYDMKGNLLGTTYDGGVSGGGTAFRIPLRW